jgi:hypothetical protein
MHCNTPDLWQVTLKMIDQNKAYGEKAPALFSGPLAASLPFHHDERQQEALAAMQSERRADGRMVNSFPYLDGSWIHCR